MQDIGAQEVAHLQKTIERKIESEPRLPGATGFQKFSRRLVKDLEARGIARTATDLVNLARYTDQKDLMKAECIRTFPTATFPASLLLRREEIESGKISGASIITPLHANIKKTSRVLGSTIRFAVWFQRL